MIAKYKNIGFSSALIFFMTFAVLAAVPINLSGQLLIVDAEESYEGEEDDGLGDFMSAVSDGEGAGEGTNLEIRGSDDVDEEVGDIRKTEYKNNVLTASSTVRVPRLPRPPRPTREFKNLGEIVSALNQRDFASTSEEVRKTILEQRKALIASELRIKKIEKASNFGVFFFGVDREALDGLKEDSMESQVRLAKLMALASSTLASSTEEVSDEELDQLQDEIEAIKSSRQKISEFVDENKGRKGMLGWFVDLFR